MIDMSLFKISIQVSLWFILFCIKAWQSTIHVPRNMRGRVKTSIQQWPGTLAGGSRAPKCFSSIIDVFQCFPFMAWQNWAHYLVPFCFRNSSNFCVIVFSYEQHHCVVQSSKCADWGSPNPSPTHFIHTIHVLFRNNIDQIQKGLQVGNTNEVNFI